MRRQRNRQHIDRQRTEDLKNRQTALANALLFKMARIYSNLYAVHRHFEDGFAEGKQRGITDEPWKFVIPIANPPDPVSFTSDEMSMLLAQKDDDVFNAVMEMDTIHNSLMAAVRTFNTLRSLLGERIAATFTVDKVDGPVISSIAKREDMRPLRPLMVDVNMMIESLRNRAMRDATDSWNAMERLQDLLRNRLGRAYRMSAKYRPSDDSSSSASPRPASPSK